MSQTQARPHPMVPIAGIATGVIAFVSVNFFVGRPVFPWSEPLQLAAPVREETGSSKPAPTGGEARYLAACASCHQADGKGLPGAFPPLAGSAWVIEDEETPVRIVLSGLSGPITVNGQPFNSMMPPPAGLDDAAIAEALTYVRGAFGNQAGAVAAETVARVRSEHASRTTPWTAEELVALRSAGAEPEAEPAAAAGGQ